MTTDEAQVEKIRAGRSAPIEDRQARWDRIQKWSATSSLAQMVELEAGVSGVSLSRERIRAIKDGARPGSVGRPRMPGLIARQRAAQGKLSLWRKKPKTEYQTAKIAEARLELAEATTAVKAEQKRTKIETSRSR
jgi:hypothetical protein